MSARIARPETAFGAQPKTAKARKDRDYMEWLHQVPCLITGTFPVEAAHLSTANAFYGHTGRGRSQKAHDRWCLSLSREQHALQTLIGEADYWGNTNPHHAAVVLYGAYLDGIEPLAAWQMVRMTGVLT